MGRSISPPLTKRRRLNEKSDDEQTNHASKPSTLSRDLRVYSWNINGIQPFIQKPITSFFKTSISSSPAKPKKASYSDTETAITASTASLRDFLRRHDFPTMLLLQEVKINPEDLQTQRAVSRSVRAPPNSSEPDYTAHFCLPGDKYNARGFGRKVYGVCSIVRSDFLETHHARVRTVEWDLEGRFQIIETEGGESGMPKLSIWNIYAVNGTDNPYKDPVTGAVTGTRHDRKLAVHALLLTECKRLESERYAVILAGDLNIARGVLDGFPNLRTFPEQHSRNRADFNEKFFESEDGLKGLDTFRHLHGDERRYTYHPRGEPFGCSCDRVDLIICSRSLEKSLTGAGMLDTPAERGPSDHCPLYASFAFGDGDKAEQSESVLSSES